MVGDLTLYLYQKNMYRYIEGYVQKVNPQKAPAVVGALLDAEADDTFINNLILSVRSLIPVEALVAEVEARNKLKMLNPFLEQLVSEGSKVRRRGGGRAAGRCRCCRRRCSRCPPALTLPAR